VKKNPKRRGNAFMKLRRFFIATVISLLIIFGNVSCAVRGLISSLPMPAILQEEELPHKVAVLPFANKTSNPEGGETVRKMFYNFFSSLNYIDIELAAIDDSLNSTDLYQKITAGEAVSPQTLGKVLGVDAVIFALKPKW
jgi:hypothetical protein